MWGQIIRRHLAQKLYYTKYFVYPKRLRYTDVVYSFANVEGSQAHRPWAEGAGIQSNAQTEGLYAAGVEAGTEEPKRFEVGKTGWVTARFTAEEPLPKRIWGKWLAESYEVTCGAGQSAKKAE